MGDWYILSDDGKTPKEATSKEWREWRENNNEKRRVASDKNARFWVSTVFLGLDHSFDGGTPILFETLVFPKEENSAYSDEDYTMVEKDGKRYATYDEALRGHQQFVEKYLSE